MNDLMYATHTREKTPDAIVANLRRDLGEAPRSVVLFYAPSCPGEEVARRLAQAWPDTSIIGCSTAGEISTRCISSGAVSAAALRPALVNKSAVALADYADGVEAGLARAVAELSTTFGPLKNLDPETHVGLIFIDSTHAVEESTHIALGNVAPMLSFVGGSAGDDLAFSRTSVVAGDRFTTHGAALMILEVSRPFRIIKACHFAPTDTRFTVTKSDGRWLMELDGRPAAEVYADYIGSTPEGLSFDNLFLNPIGLVIDGEPWLRQINPPIHKNGAVRLGCSVAEGSVVHFMKPRIPLVAHLREELSAVRSHLGEIRGGLLNDCSLRRLELKATNMTDQYARLIDFPAAGFYTHGESWLAHMHQTLTALFFG